MAGGVTGAGVADQVSGARCAPCVIKILQSAHPADKLHTLVPDRRLQKVAEYMAASEPTVPDDGMVPDRNEGR